MTKANASTVQVQSVDARSVSGRSKTRELTPEQQEGVSGGFNDYMVSSYSYGTTRLAAAVSPRGPGPRGY